MSELEVNRIITRNLQQRVDELTAENARLERDNAMLEHKATTIQKELQDETRVEVVPERIAKTILRSLVWDKANKREDIDEAFGWVDERSHYEQMGD